MTGTTILPPPPAGRRRDRRTRSRPPGERYFRHPGDVVRLVVWGARGARSLGVFLRLATDTSDGLTTDLGRAAARGPDGGARAGAGADPGRRHRRARRRRGPARAPAALAAAGSSCSVAGVAGAAVVRARSTGCVDLPGRAAGGVTERHVGGLDPLPVARRTWPARPRRRDGRQAWLSRPWRRAADLASSSSLVVDGARRHRRRARAAARRRRRRRRRRRGARRRSARRTAGRPRPWSRRRCAAAGLEVRQPRRSSAPTAGGRSSTVADAGGRAAAVRQGVRRRQPRRRPPLPRLPHARAAGPERRLAVAVARARTSSTRRCCCCWPAGRRPLPRAVARSTTLPDGSMALALDRRASARSLDALPADEIDDALLDAVWREVGLLHDARLAHRSLRAGEHPRRRRRSARHHRPRVRARSRPRRADAGHRPRRAARLARHHRRPRAGRRLRGAGHRPRTSWPPPCPSCSRWPCRRPPASRRRSRCSSELRSEIADRHRHRARRRSSGSCGSGPGRSS